MPQWESRRLLAACDTVPSIVSDIKNGSHCLAYASNDQKPQADLTSLGLDLRPDRDRQYPRADAPR